MNIFEAGFEEPKERFPEQVVIELASGFYKATNELAHLEIVDFSSNFNGIEGLTTNFKFSVLLRAESVPSYSFKVFDFGYDISLYPAHLHVQEEIGEEIGIKRSFFGTYPKICETEEILSEEISKIFKSKKFTSTVGGLMKVARSKGI